MAKTIPKLGEPYYEINKPRPLELRKMAENKTDGLEKEIQSVSDQTYEFVVNTVDKAIRDAFALYGIDADQAQHLSESGRLILLTGGFPPRLTVRVTLDGEDLFMLETSNSSANEKQLYSVGIEFTPIKTGGDEDV